MIPRTRKRLPKSFVTVPHYSHIFRGGNSFDSTKDVIFLTETNSCFATVVASKFRELTGNIFVGFASYSQSTRRKSKVYLRKTDMLKLT